MNRILIIMFLIFTLFFTSCGNKKVERISPDTVVDISGYWNDTDSKLVADAMIKDCLNHVWIEFFENAKKRKPVIIVGKINNKSLEHIPVETFLKNIEMAFVNSNTVNIVASMKEKGEIRKERISQQEFASAETRKKLKNELGADFIMLGTINMIIDEDNKKQIRFYQVNLELIDIETTQKVWIGEKKIKKLIE